MIYLVFKFVLFIQPIYRSNNDNEMIYLENIVLKIKNLL